jgi:hypothetical protein
MSTDHEHADYMLRFRSIIGKNSTALAETEKETSVTQAPGKSKQLRLVEQGIAFCFGKFQPSPFEARYIDPWVVADVFGAEALAEFSGSGPSPNQGSSLADVRQLCVDNEIAMFVDSSDFDTVVVAISEIVRTALARRGNVFALPETEPGVDQWYPDFADWLEREMPEGTVIGDPLWWASKIADRIICTPALLQQVSIPTVPEPKRVEGVGGLMEELELMVNRAADARQFGDAHFLSRAVTLLQQLQTEQL